MTGDEAGERARQTLGRLSHPRARKTRQHRARLERAACMEPGSAGDAHLGVLQEVGGLGAAARGDDDRRRVPHHQHLGPARAVVEEVALGEVEHAHRRMHAPDELAYRFRDVHDVCRVGLCVGVHQHAPEEELDRGLQAEHRRAGDARVHRRAATNGHSARRELAGEPPG